MFIKVSKTSTACFSGWHQKPGESDRLLLQTSSCQLCWLLFQ